MAQGAHVPAKSKNKAKQGAGHSQGAAVGGECFRCGRAGHFQSDCSYDPLCVLCSKEGHISANCPTRGRPLLLQQMGHAFNGCGFFNIEVDLIREETKGAQYTAMIRFSNNPLSEEELSGELKSLVDECWDWQVTRQSESEFSVQFPSRATLKLSTGSGKLHLPLSDIDVHIREAFVAPKPGKPFPSVWVQLTGLPRDVLVRDRLMAALVLVGRPIDVDELSLKKWTTEPVRVRFQCRHPERIKGSFQLCVNGEPYTIGVKAELGRSAGGPGPDVPPKPPAPRDDDAGDDESDPSGEVETWNRHGWKGNGKAKSTAEQGTQLSGAAGSSQLSRGGGSWSAPASGKTAIRIDNQYGSNLGSFPSLLEAAVSKGAIIPTAVDPEGLVVKKRLSAEVVEAVIGGEEASLVSGETTSQVTDPVEVWLLPSPCSARPTPGAGPMAGHERAGGVGLEGSLEAVEALMDAEEVLGPQGLPVVTPALEVPAVPATARGRRSKAVPVPTGTCSEAATTTLAALRKSSRYKGASASKPVLEKAMERAAEKNLETGNFVVLDHLSDSHFSTLASDCCIVFTPSAGTPAEALSMIRAKERLQGSLAAVARRQAQEATDGAAREAAQPPATDVALAQDPPRADQGVGDVEEEQTGQGLAAGRGGDSPLTAFAGGGRQTRARAPRRSTLTVRKGRGKKSSAK
ncbi:hypothetical protein QYE76_006199 [Lolium multiflorum]|uniref:CCHC-type domain-containing protein n=1 Tax=Lolium multiflorum TaxID=4521 RepID=A0AAD8RVI1_LOLMU|nr:hypothetical protein QYE76_006199 [Lolium multiflorum]